VTALGSVARTFATSCTARRIADQAGLSGTKTRRRTRDYPTGLARRLPLTAMADRFGRHRMLITTVGLGLAATVLAARSRILVVCRDLACVDRCSAPPTRSPKSSREQTDTKSRAKALASRGRATGSSGSHRIIHSLASKTLGFRDCSCSRSFPRALATHQPVGDRTGPLLKSPRSRPTTSCPPLGAWVGRFERRLILLSILAFAFVSFTGPANSFISSSPRTSITSRV